VRTTSGLEDLGAGSGVECMAEWETEKGGRGEVKVSKERIVGGQEVQRMELESVISCQPKVRLFMCRSSQSLRTYPGWAHVLGEESLVRLETWMRFVAQLVGGMVTSVATNPSTGQGRRRRVGTR
jgi:hypothetical protein